MQERADRRDGRRRRHVPVASGKRRRRADRVAKPRQILFEEIGSLPLLDAALPPERYREPIGAIPSAAGCSASVVTVCAYQTSPTRGSPSQVSRAALPCEPSGWRASPAARARGRHLAGIEGGSEAPPKVAEPERDQIWQFAASTPIQNALFRTFSQPRPSP